ncbi:MAG TPA: MFS transporter, partial [Candidatus Saccharimonadales bacterium]|nr:MFS transporter [Candidatus Saccharimonadales bacterium]
FYQEILGYTALTAGIVVAPRGFGAMAGLPMMGILTQKVDNRWLLFIGYIVFSASSFAFANVHLGISPTTLLIPIIVAGFGMSFLFVPIGNMSTATLPNPEIGNATGIFNLLRNIGGSVGIALAQTELVRRACYHQTRLAAAVPQSNPWFQQHMAEFSGYFGAHLGHANGPPAALGAMYRMMLRQSMLLSFIDVFRWCALVTVFCAGLAWLFRKVVHTEHGAEPGG